MIYNQLHHIKRGIPPILKETKKSVKLYKQLLNWQWMEDLQGFDWDKGNEEKCQKHGLRLDEIESVFESEIYISPNYHHDTEETRYQAVGMTPTGRYVFLVFCIRERTDGNFIRVISARYMHKKEVDHYEGQIKK